MRAVANSPKFAKKVGVPQSVGREFTKGDDMKGKYKKGGEAHSDAAKDKPMMKKVASAAVKGHEKRMHKKGGMTKMAAGGKMDMVKKGDKMVPAFAADGKGKMAKGGTTKMAKGGCATKKMAKGGSYRSSCDGVAQRGKTRGRMMRKGGSC